jgi:hypothetical protein
MSYSIAQYHSGKLRILIIANTARLKGFVRGEASVFGMYKCGTGSILKASPFCSYSGLHPSLVVFRPFRAKG